MTLAPRQLVLLVLLTLTWGINWPVMKIGVTEYPPLAFRAPIGIQRAPGGSVVIDLL